MGLVKDLGSPTRVLAVVNALFAPPRLREIASQHAIVVPGFRAGQAPLNLIARAIANHAFTQPPLQKTIESDIRRIAARKSADVRALSDSDASTAAGRFGTLPPPEARSSLAAMLTDTRDTVRRIGFSAVDRLVDGSLSFRARPPAHREGANRPRGAMPPPGRGPRDREPGRRREDRAPHADSARHLAALRKETTRQDRTIRRLREQLDAAKASGGSVRTAEPPDTDEAGAALARDLLLARTSLEGSLRDLSAVFAGVHALTEILLEHAVDHDTEDVVRPSSPSRRSTASPESKVHLPGSTPIWPRELVPFVMRLASSEYVESVHVLAVSPATLTRCFGFVSDGDLLAQVSDGTRAARLLIGTVATSPGTRAWIRRHLAGYGFDTAG